ncbi:AraC family transcriptional regulator [Pseudoruegeria sp. SK021]|uniref:helix-turn-helix domain-containing protein n=1 Tax=Pseudoruegeria sp. SK021 TaxID=1933035 RepID=UPI00111C5A4F|nr:helix-turn-helix transcriptional regulator [Pseudoruegeria sp. SK021]
MLDYLAVMRGFGAPVERDLERSLLPPSVEETPELYVSVPLALEWVARCGRDVEPMELGFRAARTASLASLKPSHQAAIIGGQTGLDRIKALLCVARLEDSDFRGTLRAEGDQVRVFCGTAQLERHPFICFAEWLNLQGVISVLRSVAGQMWCPHEICFVTRYPPTQIIREAFPNTRILVAQPHTSILVDRTDLALPTHDAAPQALSLVDRLDDPAEQWTFASLLRQVVQPYLNDSRLDLAMTADMVGMSKRTLQRRLGQCHLSFSDVRQEARFNAARTLLEDPKAKIIDVAIMTGYENPQHFTRAFRRHTGVTPTIYRRKLAARRDGVNASMICK